MSSPCRAWFREAGRFATFQPPQSLAHHDDVALAALLRLLLLLLPSRARPLTHQATPQALGIQPKGSHLHVCLKGF